MVNFQANHSTPHIDNTTQANFTTGDHHFMVSALIYGTSQSLGEKKTFEIWLSAAGQHAHYNIYFQFNRKDKQCANTTFRWPRLSYSPIGFDRSKSARGYIRVGDGVRNNFSQCCAFHTMCSLTIFSLSITIMA